LLFKAALMGVVEGLTEFLPVSSTGHLIVAGSLLSFNDERGKVFEIVIQFAAILAVCWEYRTRLLPLISGNWHNPDSRHQLINLFLAFLPAAFLGLLLASKIKAYLFAPVPVAMASILGAAAIFWVENRHTPAKVDSMENITPSLALKIGLCQSLALIPGMSRSGATIMGGLWLGLARGAATEFSFFLAIPTIFSATAYELFKNRHLLREGDTLLLLVGSISSFIFAFIAVRALLRFISHHTFKVFAYYRIAFGVLILLSQHFHWVSWQ